MLKFVIVLSCVAVATSMPTVKHEGFLETVVRSLRDCMDADMSMCLKEKLLSFTDSLAERKEVSLIDGVQLVSSSTKRSARSYEPLAVDAKERDNQINERILDNVQEFVDTHVLQVSMPRSFSDDSDNGLEEEGRGKKKKKALKKLLPLLAILKLKFAALIPIFLGIIAFAVFKAYILGKIAFLVAAAGFIKKIIQSKGKSEEPIHVHEESWDNGGGHGGGHGGGGWGRSAEAQKLAYSAHIKN